jgi:hypothetical protein
MISLWLRMSPHMREHLRDRAGRVLGLSGFSGSALAEIAFSILRLLFWAAVAAIRLTLRFLVRLITRLTGVYLGYRLVRHRARD